MRQKMIKNDIQCANQFYFWLNLNMQGVPEAKVGPPKTKFWPPKIKFQATRNYILANILYVFDFWFGLIENQPLAEWKPSLGW